jgi:Txe/YoeB family toxin of toxin-antitoxin system
LYSIEFTSRAKKDHEKIKRSYSYSKLLDLLRIIRHNPYQNPPPYKKLLDSSYSRRINIQHRLVYWVNEEKGKIIVSSMWTHY